MISDNLGTLPEKMHPNQHSPLVTMATVGPTLNFSCDLHSLDGGVQGHNQHYLLIPLVSK